MINVFVGQYNSYLNYTGTRPGSGGQNIKSGGGLTVAPLFLCFRSLRNGVKCDCKRKKAGPLLTRSAAYASEGPVNTKQILIR